MTESAMKAKIVEIEIERGSSGAYFATSPQLRGLQVACMSTEEVAKEVPRAIQEMYAACGVEVFVSPVEGGIHFGVDSQWVAVPTGASQVSIT